MGEDAALQIVVKLALHIGGQACGIGIGMARGEKGLQVLRNHFIEHRIAGITVSCRSACVTRVCWRARVLRQGAVEGS